MGRKPQSSARCRATALAAALAVVGALCGVAPAAVAAAASAAPPTSIHVGAQIPIVVDPSPAPPSQISASSLRADIGSLGELDFHHDHRAVRQRVHRQPRREDAFQYAVNLWKPLISSPVPIVVKASWSALGAGVLGSAGPDEVLRDRPGLPQAHTWYPIALANALAGTDLDSANPDIDATFSSAFSSWYFGTDGHPGAGQIDFVSVVLHELGHGLGFYGVANVADGIGTWQFAGYPGIFDRFTQAKGTPVLNFANSSTSLGSRAADGRRAVLRRARQRGERRLGGEAVLARQLAARQ